MSVSFRPGFLATLFTVPAILILLGLGAWQVERLEWKEQLIAELERKQSAAPQSLPQNLLNPADLLYQKVEVSGHYLNDEELFWVARTLKGAVGQRILTPFRMDDGRLILVDRGWVPNALVDAAKRTEGQLDGEITIVAALRLGGWSGSSFLKPANDDAGNQWAWVDLPAMAQALPTQGLETTYYLQAVEDPHPGDYPVATAPGVTLKNNHLEYALTWFSLAGILSVIFTVFGLRRRL